MIWKWEHNKILKSKFLIIFQCEYVVLDIRASGYIGNIKSKNLCYIQLMFYVTVFSKNVHYIFVINNIHCYILSWNFMCYEQYDLLNRH